MCVCEIPHTEYAPHIHIHIIPRVYLSIYSTSHLVCLSKHLQKEKPRDRQVAAIDDREFTLLGLLWHRMRILQAELQCGAP